MTKYTLALLPLLMASTAIAGPATDEGAKHLTEVFQTYLGSTEGVVAVAVDGDAYALTLDPKPLLDQAQEAGVTATLSPLEYSLTDNGDGTWAVKQDQPFTMSFSGPDKSELKEDVAKMTLDGTFDEKLMAFSSAKGGFEGLKATSSQEAPEGKATVEATLASGTYEMTGAAGASGGTDVTITGTGTGLVEVITAPMGEGATAMPVTIKVDSFSQKMTGSGLMLDGIYKTAAWLVAHPDDASKKAAKDEFKGILTGALPIWNNMLVEGTASKISVDTPMGPAGIDEVGFTVDINGAVKDGKFREAISLAGLTLPPGVLPAWAEPILPKKVTLDVQATGFDAAAGFVAGLGVFDLPEGMADTTAFDESVKKAFLPDGTVTVSLNPGAVTGDGYELTYQGDMKVDVASDMPTGKATVTLTGADKLQAALQAAPDDMKAQAMMGFGMAQGMAKQEGDKLVWEIDATTPGSVSVNGTPLMGGQ